MISQFISKVQGLKKFACFLGFWSLSSIMKYIHPSLLDTCILPSLLFSLQEKKYLYKQIHFFLFHSISSSPFGKILYVFHNTTQTLYLKTSMMTRLKRFFLIQRKGWANKIIDFQWQPAHSSVVHHEASNVITSRIGLFKYEMHPPYYFQSLIHDDKLHSERIMKRCFNVLRKQR